MNKRKPIILFFLISLFYFNSCSFLSEEDKEITSKIEEKYGCDITITKGIESSTSNGDKSFLRLNCSNFETDIPAPIIASDIALICHQTIKGENKYTHYIADIDENIFQFSKDTIQHIIELKENNKQILLLLQTHRFDFVYERLSELAKKEASMDDFIKIMNSYLNQENYQYIFLGFEITNEKVENEGDFTFVRFEGFLEGNNQRFLLKLIFNYTNDHDLYGIQINPLKND